MRRRDRPGAARRISENQSCPEGPDSAPPGRPPSRQLASPLPESRSDLLHGMAHYPRGRTFPERLCVGGARHSGEAPDGTCAATRSRRRRGSGSMSPTRLSADRSRAGRDGLQAGYRGLVDEPPGTPVGVAPTSLEQPHLDRWIHLMAHRSGRCERSASPARPWASYHRSHRWTAWRESPKRRATWTIGTPSPITASTAYTSAPRHSAPPTYSGVVADQAEPASPISRSPCVGHQAKPNTKHVGPRGLEPRTCGLRVRCSARLS
jgi:hypothetical protein